jgi:hypothetical protein
MQDSDQRMVAARRAAKDSIIAQIWVHYMKRMQCAWGETDWMQYNYMSCTQQQCAFCTLSFVNIKGKVYCTYMENLMLDMRNDDLSWFCLLWAFHRLRIRSDTEKWHQRLLFVKLWWSKILWWCCFLFNPPESKFSLECDTSAHLFIFQETESGEGINKMLLTTVLSEMRINWRWPLNHEVSSRAKMVYGMCFTLPR